MSSFCLQHGGNAGESMVYNVVTTFCQHCINVVLQRLASVWSSVVCHPWAIVVYIVEPTLDQHRNVIWVVGTLLADLHNMSLPYFVKDGPASCC